MHGWSKEHIMKYITAIREQCDTLEQTLSEEKEPDLIKDLDRFLKLERTYNIFQNSESVGGYKILDISTGNTVCFLPDKSFRDNKICVFRINEKDYYFEKADIVLYKYVGSISTPKTLSITNEYAITFYTRDNGTTLRVSIPIARFPDECVVGELISYNQVTGTLICKDDQNIYAFSRTIRENTWVLKSINEVNNT